MRKETFYFLVLLFVLPTFGSVSGQRSDERQMREEEIQDYYRKWLEQDVIYIISDEEKAVFKSLTTPEEKEQFIEQFWFRRDPDPRTSSNEFKEEHYRRIAYANEKFTSGDPGWLTDRGRIYIIHGEPDSIIRRPTGGVYVRPIEEGGGTTAVHPYEKWRYRYLEGIGDDVELEFVDATGSEDYKLAVFYWEKDSLMMSPGAGKTLAEETGESTRAERPGLMPAAGGAMYGAQSRYRRVHDNPFHRYELIARVGGTPAIKHKDLKEMVEVNIQFENLPFSVKADYFKLNDAQVLVPVTVQLSNRDLTFEKEGDLNVARVAVYGMVTSLSGRIATEFDDDLVIRHRDSEIEVSRQRSSIYQKILPLDTKGRYKLDLVLKETSTGKTGVIRQVLVPPTYSEEQLQGSSMVLANSIKQLEVIPDKDEMFVIGDVQVLPRMDHEFSPGMPLGVYFQLYNVELDQATFEPSLKVTFNLIHDGKVLRQSVDESGDSLQFVSGRRVVITKLLSLVGLEPGKYEIEIQVEDRLSDRTLERRETFRVVGDAQS